MKIPSYVWIVLLILVSFGGLYFISNQRNKQEFENVQLPVEVEVYVDFNCPHCADFEPYVQQARQKYGEKANIELKMLPFLTAGQNPDTSVEYANAAIAARKQGKFNEYTDGLFKWITYRKTPTHPLFTFSDAEKELFAEAIDLDALAEFLELDVEQFKKDRVSEEVRAEVKAEKDKAIAKMGAASTPTIFIYGKQFKMQTFDDFDKQIASLIEQAEANQQEETVTETDTNSGTQTVLTDSPEAENAGAAE
jgi:protein-disulfide isomerase